MCNGHYGYTVILFGLVNALVAFQGYINNVLRKHLDKFCIAYLVDIIVYSNLLGGRGGLVWLVFTQLQEAGLYLKLLSCKFDLQRISFVNFIVILEGVEMEPD